MAYTGLKVLGGVLLLAAMETTRAVIDQRDEEYHKKLSLYKAAGTPMITTALEQVNGRTVAQHDDTTGYVFKGDTLRLK